LLAPPGGLDDYYVEKGMMFTAWVEWCKQNGHKFHNSIHFGKTLTTHMPTIKASRVRIEDERIKGKTHRVYIYDNVVLTDEAYQTLLGISRG